MMRKKILFIQHAAGFGGSAMSLLYTLQEINKVAGEQYSLVIALAKWNKSLSDLYEQAGFEVVKPSIIDTYEHTQAVSYNLLNPLGIIKEIKQLFNINKSITNTEKLIQNVKPDLIHLNSVVLVGSAYAAKKQNIPLVWHVRENPVKGLFKIRYNFLKRILEKLADKVIFICNADKEGWGNPKNGLLVYNFVDFEKFQAKASRPNEIDGVEIPQGDLNVLFLGGVAQIKGGLYLIQAINALMLKYPDKNIFMLFPGGIYTQPKYLLYAIAKRILPLIGQGTYSQKIEKEIENSIKKRNFIKFPFVKDVAKLLAASDVLVFPSVRPHFARPIIEAGAMMKPVIGSELDGVKELIKTNQNGFLVKPKSTSDIMKYLEILLLHSKKGKDMGKCGYEIAQEKFQAKNNILKIIETYNALT